MSTNRKIRSAPLGYAAEYPITEFSWVFSPIKHLILYHLSLTLGLTDIAVFWNTPALFLWPQGWKEIHFQGVRQLRRRPEREVHILMQHLRDVRPRHLHPPRQLRLRNPQLLHAQQNLPQKSRSYFVDVHITGFELLVSSFGLRVACFRLRVER